MKKYLKITGSDVFWATDEISKDDLVQVVQGSVDVIVNTEEGTFFNVSENKWEPIPNN